MNGKLLVSKKTYSLSKRKSIVEWTEIPFEVKDLYRPHDFEIRFVNAELSAIDGAAIDISSRFPELQLKWSAEADIRSKAKDLISCNRGLTDIVWYAEDMKIAFII